MTSQHVNLLNEDAASSLKQSVIASDAFQAWQSELQDFVIETHDRLHLLCQSLAQARVVQASQSDALEMAAQEMAVQGETAALSTANEEETTPEVAVPPEVQVEAPQDDVVADRSVSDFDDHDPIERLNAIKRRLAIQMENAS